MYKKAFLDFADLSRLFFSKRMRRRSSREQSSFPSSQPLPGDFPSALLTA